MKPVVFKFGGASLRNAEGIRRMADLLQNFHPQKPCWVVVSAMGKTTNALEKMLDAFFRQGDYQPYIFGVATFHREIVSELFPPDHKIFEGINHILNDLQFVLEQMAERPYDLAYDQVVSFGEKLSAEIFTSYCSLIGLKAAYVPSENWLRTDERFREGRVDFEKSSELLRVQKIPENTDIRITQGFVGGTETGLRSTLGREGSDYTAAILAYLLDAREVVIWKDVPGMLNADPDIFRQAVQIPELSYRDAIELAYFGASVIHPRTLQPLQQKKIPLRVAGFMQPEASGTLIRETSVKPEVPAIIVKQNQVLLAIQPRDLSFVMEEFTGNLFQLLADLKIRVNLIQHSAVTLRLCIDSEPRRMARLKEALEGKYEISEMKDLALVTLRWYTPSLVEELQKNRIVHISQTNGETIRFVTDQPDAWNSRQWS